MGQLSDAVRNHLESIGFHFREDDGRFEFGMSGRNGNWSVIARARDSTDQIVVHSRAPFNVPEEKRQAFCEFLTRANYGLTLGNFEMDMNDGEVRYKTSADLEDVTEIPDAVIRHLIGANLATIDRYLPGMFAVLYAETDPAEAVRTVEGRSDSDSVADGGSRRERIRGFLRGSHEAGTRNGGGNGDSDGSEPPASGPAPHETLRAKLERARAATLARQGGRIEKGTASEEDGKSE